jgi:hypothetical protein
MRGFPFEQDRTGWIWVFVMSLLCFALALGTEFPSLKVLFGAWLGIAIWELFKRWNPRNQEAAEGALRPIDPPNYGRFRRLAIVLILPAAIIKDLLGGEVSWALLLTAGWVLVCWDTWRSWPSDPGTGS